MFSKECGLMVDGSVLSQQELARQFDAFHLNVSKGLYSPGKWAKEHLSPDVVNPNVMGVICSKVQLQRFDDGT